MNIKNWVKFYLHTLLIGGIVTNITGFIVQWDKYQPFFVSFDIAEIGMVALWLVGLGLIFATISQMGYFAYLTIHRFGLGFFRSLWNPVQVVLIAFVLFDFVYLRYNSFASENESVWPYVLVALFLLLIGIVIGYLKANQSNKSTFIPAVFFIVCATIIEWFPVLRANDSDWLHLMLYPLLICNAYQLLILPRYLAQSKEERLALKNRKENLTTGISESQN